MTFPACYVVGDALLSPHWLRRKRAEDCEPFIAGQYKPLEFQPLAMMHGNGIIAAQDDYMGMYGVEMTVLAQAPKVTYEEIPPGGLSEVSTPPTPPRGWSHAAQAPKVEILPSGLSEVSTPLDLSEVSPPPTPPTPPRGRSHAAHALRRTQAGG